MKKLITHIFYLCLALCPSFLKRLIYNNFLGCEIHKTARLGLSYIQAQNIKMGAHSKIGHFNTIRNLALLEMGDHSSMGNSNHVSAPPLHSKKHFQEETDRVQALIIGAHSAIVKKNFFDCNNSITIGHHSIVAGFGSAFFTHSINVEENRQQTAPITISDYCMVGACCVITRGAVLPNYSLLGANSTLHKPYEQTHTLYSGVPALPVKKLDPSAGYFHREAGFVG